MKLLSLRNSLFVMLAILLVSIMFETGATAYGQNLNATLVSIPTGHGTFTCTGAGLDDPSYSGDCTATDFVYGSDVTIHAEPDANNIFSGWGGACSGTALDCTVVADGRDVYGGFIPNNTLGGMPKQGNLSITMFPDGTIDVFRFIDGQWQDQIFNNTEKGSLLYVNGTSYWLGNYFSHNATDTLSASQQRLSDRQYQNIWIITDDISVTQTITYAPESGFYNLNWDITNTGIDDLNDLRFFHGEDTYLDGNDSGSGFWDSANNTIGVQRSVNSVIEQMALQAVTPPFGYESDYIGNIYDSFGIPALSDAVDSSAATDNGYALEWRSDTLPAGETWSVSAFEKFSSIDEPSGISVLAPVTSNCTVRVPCTLNFSVSNSSDISQTVDLSISSDQMYWAPALLTASPIIVSAGGAQNVLVTLTIPSNIVTGTIGHVTLTASFGVSARVSTSDSAAVTITPEITWDAPADIQYGTPLSSAQLNAAVTGVDGTFVYTPAEGTILSPGNNQTLSVAFKPTDSINYTGATKSVTINVIEAVPVITWANPAPITYGAALGATQLNATASVAGAFTYDPPAGTVLNAGSQTLTVTFNPTDAPNSSGQTASVTLIVNKATPVITWANPAPITYGTALGATQLDASSGAVAGSFTYNPAAGAILNAGNGQVLSAAFTPTDPNYSSTSATAAINVNKAAPVITWANPAPITYGTALSSSQLNASSGSAAGSFTYNPAAGAILNAGNGQVLSAAFTSTDPNYSSASATAAINVNKATPVISWANPAPITYGTALSGSQLNATASVAGTFTYAPVSGTVLNVGSQTLSVTFNPTDTVNYVPRTVTVSLVVQEDYLADALRAVRISIGLELDDLSLDVAPLENCSTSDGVTRCTSHPDGHTDLGDVIVLMRRAQGLVIW